VAETEDEDEDVEVDVEEGTWARESGAAISCWSLEADMVGARIGGWKEFAVCESRLGMERKGVWMRLRRRRVVGCHS
jgi:hypothetical protein